MTPGSVTIRALLPKPFATLPSSRTAPLPKRMRVGNDQTLRLMPCELARPRGGRKWERRPRTAGVGDAAQRIAHARIDDEVVKSSAFGMKRRRGQTAEPQQREEEV